ncbi:MAG: hypothetical protein OEW42_07205 [Acidimicrobiia bacterium]|nr:hypothetical protein [Acidimicrobiia bacterium]
MTGADAVWAVEPMTPRRAAVLDQLAAEIRDTVAICVVSARDRRVLAHHAPEAFTPEELGDALYALAGSAIEATAVLGGEELFGVVRDGMVLTESAVIHYRVVGEDRAIIVLADLPDQLAHLEVSRRVLAAYDDFVAFDGA